MWYIGKGLQIIGLVQVLFGIYVGFSQDDLAAEFKIALIGIGIFIVGRLIEMKFGRKA
ncbi:hypothetical protein GWO43_07535 [candidate division KSB1 bacterium]|nr:hypothetical protein [candidate division KSB1 bacterium]NIR73031.1 hypothetical protein [candidate division KSB1 bacterium]NIS23811.1 hypothetical protein [candidate division KSB1 bacterium]NIT70738.1 hypothetical protein [candidate division KSB1 bacterium]NIU94342.1 hypothetical protein [candidate division KSB1 bacterium]